MISLFQTFIAVAERGSFTAAAHHVHLSQAAVGQQMRRLEQHLHVALFDRTQKSPRLNQLGKAIVPRIKELLQTHDGLLDGLTGEARMIGELTLGAIPSTIRGLIPISIKRLIALYPDLHIRVVPDLSGDLQEQIERGALDAAVLSAPRTIGRSLTWFPFVEEKLILVTAPEITSTDPKEILHNMPYIRHIRSAPVGLLADEWLMRANISVRVSMEMGTLEDLATMVAHNLGVSIVPNICVPDDTFARLRKVPLHDYNLCRTLGILTHADCSKIRLVEKLLEQIEYVVADYQKISC